MRGTDTKNFRDEIKHYLNSVHKTQKDLAEAINLAPITLNMKLNGSRNLTNAEVASICKILIQWNAFHDVLAEISVLLRLLNISLDTFDLSVIQEFLPITSQNLKIEDAFETKVSSTNLFSVNNRIPHALTPFIGRLTELKQLKQLLQDKLVRLITLTGVGGSGKTRLALELADSADFAKREIRFIEFAPILEDRFVISAITRAFGLREQSSYSILETVIQAINNYEQPILILDNCEHLIVEVSKIAYTLLTRCPNLTIVATSREALRIPGEYVITILPLSIPQSDVLMLSTDEILAYDAVQLFISYSKYVQLDFSLEETDIRTICQICQKLDGIPLAIELATARLRALTVNQLLERLNSMYSLLGSGNRNALPRQQTLYALVDWSYDLLTEKEKLVFQKLCVFVGSWSLEAVERVIQPVLTLQNEYNFDVTNEILALFDKSLLQKVHGNRYRLLETIREFGLLKLKQRPEFDLVSESYSHYYLQYVERVMSNTHNYKEYFWQELIDVEITNINAALAWFEKVSDIENWIRMGVTLCEFWYSVSYINEWFKFLDDSESKIIVDKRLKALLLTNIGIAALERDNLQKAKKNFEESMVLYEEIEDEAGIADTLGNLGVLLQRDSDYLEAQVLFEKALDINKKLGRTWQVAWLLYNIGSIYIQYGDYQTSEKYFTESLQIHEKNSDKYGLTATVLKLIDVHTCLGSLDKALTLHHQSLQLKQEIGSRNYYSTYLAKSYFFSPKR